MRSSNCIFSPNLREGIDVEAKGIKKPSILPMVFHSPNIVKKFSPVPFATPSEGIYELQQIPSTRILKNRRSIIISLPVVNIQMASFGKGPYVTGKGFLKSGGDRISSIPDRSPPHIPVGSPSRCPGRWRGIYPLLAQNWPPTEIPYYPAAY